VVSVEERRVSTVTRPAHAGQGDAGWDGADLRDAAAALREAATARGDCDGGWGLAELALLFEREADLADLEDSRP
jgi:hypothetical protein